MTKAIYLVLLVGFISACNKPSSNPQNPGLDPNLVADEISNKVSASFQIPALNDYKEFIEYAYLQQTPTGEKCNYLGDSRTTVSSVSADAITFSFDYTIQLSNGSAASCPAQPVGFVAHKAKLWAMNDWIQHKKQNLLANINPSRYTKLSWVASAFLISSTETKERGLRAQLVKIQVTGTNGVVCTYNKYFSLDSFFMGEFENYRTCGSNSLTNYMQLRDYSIVGLPK